MFPDVAAANIHRYVAKHKGWSRRDYRLERHRDREGYAVYFVLHRRERPVPGRGKSFVVYCDPVKYRWSERCGSSKPSKPIDEAALRN